ncbi:Uma2 family endonuclease, partial [Streptomyces sp. SID8380]|nr:Uma2 family endonuclease [Streptomyces sp. SID8380]
MAIPRDDQGDAMAAMYPEYAQWLRQ